MITHSKCGNNSQAKPLSFEPINNGTLYLPADKRDVQLLFKNKHKGVLILIDLSLANEYALNIQ